ncbi:Capsid NCLDV superfamily domain protein [Mollivirus kamchatka]|nr:Capsid NCLDV superfamily domain protein [Mollivirus kamchatka]
MTDHLLASTSHRFNNAINDTAVSLADISPALPLQQQHQQANGVGAMSVASILTSDAKASPFRLRFCKVGGFSMSSHNLPFNEGEVAFGGAATCTLKHLGHMIYHTYLVMDFEAIKAARRVPTSDDPNCSIEYPSEYPVEGAVIRKADERAVARYAAERTGTLATARAGKAIYNAEAYGATRGAADASSKWDPFEESLMALDRSINCSAKGDSKKASRSASKKAPVRGWVRWINGVAQYAAELNTLIVEDGIWDTQPNLWLYGWEQVAGMACKRLNEHVGLRDNTKQLVMDSAERQRFYVPLPFFFTLCSGSVFPYSQFNKKDSNSTVKIETKFADLRQLIVVSGDGVVPVRASDGKPLTNNDLKAHIRATYVHLNKTDARTFANGNQIMVITQVQHHSTTLPQGKQVVDVPVPFGGPIIFYMWMLRRKASVDQNSHWNFSGVNGREPLLSNVFYINGKPLFGVGDEARVYRLLEPLQSFRSTPCGNIYVKSFAIDATAVVPNGFLDATGKTTSMRLTLQQALVHEEVEFIIMARSFEVAIFEDHHASLLGNHVCRA